MKKLKESTIAALLFAQLQSPNIEFISSYLQNNAFAYHQRTSISQLEKDKIEELIKRLKKDGFNPTTIDSLFEDQNFKLERGIAAKFRVNPERRYVKKEISYDDYKKSKNALFKKLLTPFVMLWYRQSFNEAEEKYGVAKRYNAAILVLESGFRLLFDRIGGYKALNALASQYVLAQNRQNFAYRNIKGLLRFSEKAKIPVYSLYSSYAGAMSCSQMLPENMHLFVGNNPTDIKMCIDSIGNFLMLKGWDKTQNGKPVEKGSKNWMAIYAYNPNKAYVRLVIEIGDSLRWLP